MHLLPNCLCVVDVASSLVSEKNLKKLLFYLLNRCWRGAEVNTSSLCRLPSFARTWSNCIIDPGMLSFQALLHQCRHLLTPGPSRIHWCGVWISRCKYQHPHFLPNNNLQKQLQCYHLARFSKGSSNKCGNCGWVFSKLFQKENQRWVFIIVFPQEEKNPITCVNLST